MTVSDDIVARLRVWDDQQPPFTVMLEAAAEIERLRALVRELQADVAGGKNF